MPSDFSMKAMNALHRGLLRVSGGRVGWGAMGMPMIELTTTGRKSGQKRAIMLSSPIQVDGSYVVVASRGGDDKHPAWFLNLRDNPEVEVFHRDERWTMLARVATSEERAELWPRITATYRNYAAYQRKTDREIPLVFLDPRR